MFIYLNVIYTAGFTGSKGEILYHSNYTIFIFTFNFEATTVLKDT